MAVIPESCCKTRGYPRRFVEHDTHKAVLAEMKALGIPDHDIRVLAGTGIIADIRGTAAPIAAASDGAAAPVAGAGADGDVVIAVRSDIDALPMTEDTGDLPWKSTRPGAAHMCGHDGHMANLMGLARLVAARRDRLPSNRVLRLVWQPAEEGPGGAKPMVEAGAMRGVCEVYGFHNWPTFPLGNVHVVAGAAMAHVTDFDVTVRGRGGHASTPHVLADPVVAAAHCVVALQTVVSRSVHSADSAVVSVSTIHGGEARNVIPSAVTFSGTIRDLSPTAGAVIYERFPAVVKATAMAHGCEADVSLESLYPVLRNDAGAAENCRRVGARVLGADRVASWGLPLMGGEDFGFFSDEVPGCYVFFGTAEKGETASPGRCAVLRPLPLPRRRCHSLQAPAPRAPRPRRPPQPHAALEPLRLQRPRPPPHHRLLPPPPRGPLGPRRRGHGGAALRRRRDPVLRRRPRRPRPRVEDRPAHLLGNRPRR